MCVHVCNTMYAEHVETFSCIVHTHSIHATKASAHHFMYLLIDSVAHVLCYEQVYNFSYQVGQLPVFSLPVDNPVPVPLEAPPTQANRKVAPHHPLVLHQCPLPGGCLLQNCLILRRRTQKTVSGELILVSVEDQPCQHTW